MITPATPNPPSDAEPDPESFEQDAKQLAKLTTNFYAALNHLLPTAIRASKRGKHGLLRLISRKLPRPKLQATEDLEDRTADDDAEAIGAGIRALFEKAPVVNSSNPEEPKEKEEPKKREEPPAQDKAKSAQRDPIAPPTAARTSGAPRSLNEEPWPGQKNLPRSYHRRLKK